MAAAESGRLFRPRHNRRSMSDESSVAYGERARAALGFSRWWQVAAAVGMMAAVSPYQYVWSSVASPLSESLDVAQAALGAVFSFYVVFQSLSQFPAGRWRDRRGPGALTGLAALLAGGATSRLSDSGDATDDQTYW